MIIRNEELLVKNSKISSMQKGRFLALKSLESALDSVEPKKLLKSKIRVLGSNLLVDSFCFDLEKFKHIYVVGGGKAGEMMVEGLEEVLGTRLTSGVVNVPTRKSKLRSGVVELNEASHPIPNEAGVEGTERMMAIAELAEEDDLLICLISGGGSSLMPLPREGLSLAEKQVTTSALLKSGATISEINAVRKHLSAFKGGGLAKKAYPATVLNLVLSDVVGDPLDAIASGPTVPDLSTYKDAVTVLKNYNLWEKAPLTVRKILTEGVQGHLGETPKPENSVFSKVNSVVIGNNRTAGLAAFEYLKSKGLKALFLSASLEGEAKHVGTFLSSMAREITVSGNPVGMPSAIVIGGETTVTVRGKGIGGRNQELALSAAIGISNVEGCVIASMSTDGTDGPTDAAGAIVDHFSAERASEAGLSPHDYLNNNDAYTFFSKIGDLIFTGPTGTNVNDLSVIVLM